MGRRTFTAAQRRALEAWLDAARPLARLADWTVTVSWETAPDGDGEVTLAQITNDPRKKHAVLQVGATFLELSPAAQTQVLTHELVHCHLHAFDELARSVFGLLDDGERRVAEVALTQQLEYTTDALADALAPHLPMLTLTAADTGQAAGKRDQRRRQRTATTPR